MRGCEGKTAPLQLGHQALTLPMVTKNLLSREVNQHFCQADQLLATWAPFRGGARVDLGWSIFIVHSFPLLRHTAQALLLSYNTTFTLNIQKSFSNTHALKVQNKRKQGYKKSEEINNAIVYITCLKHVPRT